MSDDSKELSRMEDILSGEDYLPKKPMSRIEELLLDGAMVPKVDDTDNGKVLKVIDGEWKPGEDVSGDNLPPVSSLDNGKVLKVVNGEWNIGSDKSDIVMVQMGVSYASFKDSSQVTLPANIKSVLLANYYSNPPVPTYLITTDSVIFQPIEVNKSSGTTPLVQIRWGRFHSELDSVTHESNVYNDSIIYNTQDNDTIARFTKSAALQTIPPVDSTDEGKVMQVGNDGTWQANDLPTYDEVPSVPAYNVGKYLKATATGEYGWASIPKDALFLSYDFFGGELNLPSNLGITMADSTAPIFLKNATVAAADYGKIFYPVSKDSAITLGVVENASWECISVETVNGSDVTYIEKIIYNMDADTHDETATYSKAELKAGGGVAVPPVIFDNGNLKKMTVDNFPGLEKVYLTAEEYALLTTAEKQDLSKIYYVSPYKYYDVYDDGTVIIRTYGTTYEWFFNGMVIPTNYSYINIPEQYVQYTKNDPYEGSTAWSDATSTTSLGIIEMGPGGYTNRISAQTGNWGGTVITNTPIYGKVVIGNGDSQANVYSDPYDTPSPIEIYYGNKQYTDFDIPDPLPAVTSTDNGKALIVNSDGEWDKGDIPSTCTPVEIEAADYHALTTPQKEDTTKVYFVKAGRVITDPVSVIPRNPSSSKIGNNTDGSSYATSATLAFDGVMNTAYGRVDQIYDATGWTPGYGNTVESAWISYEFDTAISSLTTLEVYAWNMATTSPTTTWTTPVIVEGSTDGTTWFNILADGASSFTLSSKESEFVKNVIPLDNTVSVNYIRFRFLNKVNYFNDITFAIAEIYAYTGNVIKYDDSTYYKGIKHGKTVQELPDLVVADEGKVLKAVNGKWAKDVIYVECTQADYDLLPSSKNSDGIIYFITD